MRVVRTPVLLDDCPSIIHAQPCEHCPSAHGDPDPETLDVMSWPIEERAALAFPCAWRREKYCKGYCDKMGVTAEMLDGLPK